MAKNKVSRGGVIHQGKPEGYLSVREAQAAFECSEATVWRWVQQKLVKAVRYRHRVYVCVEDVRQLDAVRPYRRQPAKNSYTRLLRTGTPEARPAGQLEAQP
jgi:hypothetical protein